MIVQIQHFLLFLESKSRVTSLLRRLGVAALSSDVAEQSVTDMYEPCPQVQLFAHKVVPLIQKMLYSDSESEHNVYDRLKERGIKNKLAVIQFGQVKLNKITRNITVPNHAGCLITFL